MARWLQEAEQLRQSGAPFAIATVVGAVGSTPREVGAKLLVRQDGSFVGTVGGGQLERLVIQDALKCLAQGRPHTFRYPLGPKAGQCCGGAMDVLVEPINAGPTLLLFGGGHVGQALCRVLEGTPFRVELVEEREEWVGHPQLPPSVIRRPEPWEDVVAKVRWDAERTYVVVMTHRHDVDEEIVAGVLPHPRRFLGLIGSESKWRRFQARLLERGFSQAQLDQVQCPLGARLGKAPQEVAISIAAELLKAHHREPETPRSP